MHRTIKQQAKSKNKSLGLNHATSWQILDHGPATRTNTAFRGGFAGLQLVVFVGRRGRLQSVSRKTKNACPSPHRHGFRRESSSDSLHARRGHGGEGKANIRCLSWRKRTQALAAAIYDHHWSSVDCCPAPLSGESTSGTPALRLSMSTDRP